MSWEIEYTDEFEAWWNTLNEDEQDTVAAHVGMLEFKGPHLRFPYSSGIHGSRYSHLRELRIQYRGEPFRVLYAFDPRRVGILLLGGSKVGDERWYQKHIPLADKLYRKHLETLRKEGQL
jgi:hypothetical protein